MNSRVENILKLIQTKYPDKVSPGIVCSYIKNKKQYYISVVRYVGKTKTVLFSTYNNSLTKALDTVENKLENM